MIRYTLSIKRLFGYSLTAELEDSDYKYEKFFEWLRDDGELEVWFGRLHLYISNESRYT